MDISPKLIRLFRYYYTSNGGGITAINTLSFNEASLNVYPNPAKSDLNIEFNLQQSDAVTILLYDENGKELKKIDKGQLSKGNHKFHLILDKKIFSDGTYFCKVAFDDKMIRKQFIIAQ